MHLQSRELQHPGRVRAGHDVYHGHAMHGHNAVVYAMHVMSHHVRYTWHDRARTYVSITIADDAQKKGAA